MKMHQFLLNIIDFKVNGYTWNTFPHLGKEDNFYREENAFL